MTCKNDHVSVHHPARDKIFCAKCHAYVLTDNDKCICCMNPTKGKKKYHDLNMLFSGMLQTYESIVTSYITTTVKAPVMLYCKHKLVTYAIPLSIFAVYADTNQAKHLTPKQKQILRDNTVLDFLNTFLKPVGLF